MRPDRAYLDDIENFNLKTDVFISLYKMSEFYESVSGSYLDTTKLKYRIEKTKEVLL